MQNTPLCHFNITWRTSLQQPVPGEMRERVKCITQVKIDALQVYLKFTRHFRLNVSCFINFILLSPTTLTHLC